MPLLAATLVLTASCTADDDASAGAPFEGALEAWQPGPVAEHEVQLTVYLEDGRLHAIAPTAARFAVGEVLEATADTLTLGPDPNCEPADEGGTYSVLRDGDTVRFTAVEDDSCRPRQDLLTAAPWRPTDLPPTATEVPAAVPTDVVMTVPLPDTTFLRPFAGSVWAVKPNDTSLYRIDPGTGAVTETEVGSYDRLRWLAVGEGSVWVTDSQRDLVHRVDPATGTVVASIPAGTDPDGVLPGADAIWVVGHESGTISRVDLVTGAIDVVAQDLADPQNAILVDGQVVVAVPEESELLRIDPQTLGTEVAYRGRLIGEIAATTSDVWLVEGLSAEWVTRIDDDGAVAARVFVGTDRWVRGVAADGDILWVCTVGADGIEDAPAELLRVDATTDTVVDRYDVGRAGVRSCRAAVDEVGDVWLTTEQDVARVRPAEGPG